MEMYYITGALKDKKDRRDLRVAGITKPAEIPPVFVLEDPYDSKNQTSRGSCTAHAQTHHKERQEKVRLSARFVMAKTKEYEGNTGYGAYTRNTFRTVNKIGAAEEQYYPEPGPEMSWEEYIDVNYIPLVAIEDAKKHKSESYWRVEPSIEAIKQSLYQNRDKEISTVISMSWYAEFNRPTKGLLPTVFSNYVGGHAVEVKGYNDISETLTIKNSWGEWWGDKGDFYMPYSIFPSVILDAWMSLDIPKELAVDQRYGIKRTWDSFMREKSIAFNPWLRKQIGRLPNNREIMGLAYGFWDWESIFRGRNGDLWLNMTKQEAIKQGLYK